MSWPQAFVAAVAIISVAYVLSNCGIHLKFGDPAHIEAVKP